jgi:uncharacterized protein with HEPN domain
MPLRKAKDPKAYLYDMLESARCIQQYMKDVSFEQFMEDSEKRDAVALRLSVIGEAAGHIDESIPGLPLKELRGMRNRIAHGYGLVDLKIVWEVTQVHITPLISLLSDYLARIDPETKISY